MFKASVWKAQEYAHKYIEFGGDSKTKSKYQTVQDHKRLVVVPVLGITL
jgi:hypothetical protein